MTLVATLASLNTLPKNSPIAFPESPITTEINTKWQIRIKIALLLTEDEELAGIIIIISDYVITDSSHQSGESNDVGDFSRRSSKIIG